MSLTSHTDPGLAAAGRERLERHIAPCQEAESQERDVLDHIEPNGFRVVEAGAFELKGIDKPLTLYEAIRDHS